MNVLKNWPLAWVKHRHIKALYGLQLFFLFLLLVLTFPFFCSFHSFLRLFSFFIKLILSSRQFVGIFFQFSEFDSAKLYKIVLYLNLTVQYHLWDVESYNTITNECIWGSVHTVWMRGGNMIKWESNLCFCALVV